MLWPGLLCFYVSTLFMFLSLFLFHSLCSLFQELLQNYQLLLNIVLPSHVSSLCVCVRVCVCVFNAHFWWLCFVSRQQSGHLVMTSKWHLKPVLSKPSSCFTHLQFYAMQQFPHRGLRGIFFIPLFKPLKKVKTELMVMCKLGILFRFVGFHHLGKVSKKSPHSFSPKCN